MTKQLTELCGVPIPEGFTLTATPIGYKLEVRRGRYKSTKLITDHDITAHDVRLAIFYLNYEINKKMNGVKK